MPAGCVAEPQPERDPHAGALRQAFEGTSVERSAPAADNAPIERSASAPAVAIREPVAVAIAIGVTVAVIAAGS